MKLASGPILSAKAAKPLLMCLQIGTALYRQLGWPAVVTQLGEGAAEKCM
jgi:hypothetical protein